MAHPRQTGLEVRRTILIDSAKSMKLRGFPEVPARTLCRFPGKSLSNPPHLLRIAMSQTLPDLSSPETLAVLGRIADALERLAPKAAPEADFLAADAFVWHAAGR